MNFHLQSGWHEKLGDATQQTEHINITQENRRQARMRNSTLKGGRGQAFSKEQPLAAGNSGGKKSKRDAH